MTSAAEQKGIIAWFVHNPVAANLMMAAILLAGILSLFSIQRSLNPDIESPLIDVSIVYPGAAPGEVEKGVTIKVEEALKELESISRIQSISDESLSHTTIEIRQGYDVLAALDDIQARVERIATFPENIEKPIIGRQQIKHQAIILQLQGELDEKSMKLLAQDIKDEMLQNEDISSISILGTRPYEIAIEIPQIKLREHQLTITQVAQAIRSSSIDIAGGSIQTRNGNILLRAQGQAYNQFDFENIILKTFEDSSTLTIGDVATINDGFEEVSGYARFDGKRGVTLTVFAVGDQDLLRVSEQAKAYVEQKNNSLPAGVELIPWADVTHYLEGRLSMMTDNMLMGGILVFISLSLFLNLRIAFWTIAGLPVCFMGALALMPLPGIDVTLNMISLFGFILVLGIVVDDAIIIGESIHDVTEDYGDTKENVIIGANRVAMPATFGVLTTIAAFAPTVFTTGMYAAIPQAIGYVVIFCLIFSLIESKFILPSHLANRMRAKKVSTSTFNKKIESAQQIINDGLRHFIEFRYRPFLEKAIDFRYQTVAVFVALLFLTLGLFNGGFVRYVMFPDIPSDFVIAEVDMTEGASREQTANAISQIETAMQDIQAEYEGEDFIEHWVVVGDGNRKGFALLELTKNEDRAINADQIVKLWRTRVGEIAGSRSVNFSSIEDAGFSALSFKVTGDNPQNLEQAAIELVSELARYKGVYDIDSSANDRSEELSLRLKPLAQSLNIQIADLGTQVRHAFYGAEAQRVQRGTDEVKVIVRYPRQDRESLATLDNMVIFTDQGEEVPFTSVVEVNRQPAYSKTTRIDGENAVLVTAKADKYRVEPSQINKEILAIVAPSIEAKYNGVKIKLDGAAVEEKQTQRNTLIAFTLALAAVYILLAIPLGSYFQPIIIMVVIPFGIVGAVLGHWFMGAAVNVLSLFGIIALNGVVVNDSLIMVHFVNAYIKSKRSIHVAAVEAGCQRFRAIIITSMTTFIGLVPILLERSLQAQLVIPMAISLAFGILFSTVITLILVPCLYVIMHDVKLKYSRSNNNNNPVLEGEGVRS